MAVLIIEHIEQTPNVAHGAPRISGTRIRVQDVVNWYLRVGRTVEQIVQEFELSPAQIYAALAYYYDHQAEIDQALDEDERADVGEDLRDLRTRIAQRRK